MVGGGGLIQIPALLLLFPHLDPATVLGTNLLLAHVLGGWLGSRLAMRRGSPFIRKFFLWAVAAILARLIWDMRG